MKITSIESCVLGVPTRKPMALEFADHRLVAATIHTEEGPTGLGYSLAFGGGGAEAIQVYLSPHVVHELSLQVVGALPNSFLVEFMDWAPPDLFVDLPRCEDGFFRVPDRPGHGMALQPGAEKKYRLS